jgi:hypothetical protein
VSGSGDLACSKGQAVAFFGDLRAMPRSWVPAEALPSQGTRILATSCRRYVLAVRDHARAAVHCVCRLDGIDGLIMDATADDALAAALPREEGRAVTVRGGHAAWQRRMTGPSSTFGRERSMYLSPVILPASPTCRLLSTAATACSLLGRGARHA